MSRFEYLRTQRCAIGWFCDGPIQVHHHTGGRGRGQKADDSRTFPLCMKHHAEFHNASGHFRDWSKTHRREWQDMMVARFTPAEDVF